MALCAHSLRTAAPTLKPKCVCRHVVSAVRLILAAQVANNIEFKKLLEKAPGWRQIVNNFTQSNYAQVFTALDRIKVGNTLSFIVPFNIQALTRFVLSLLRSLICSLTTTCRATSRSSLAASATALSSNTSSALVSAACFVIPRV